MNSPQPPKHKCTLSPAHQAPHHKVTSNEEEDEIVDSNKSLSKPEEDSDTDTTSLTGHYTIIISELKPEDYTTALSHLQGLSLPIVADRAPFCSVTGTMGLDIPMAELKDTVAVLMRAWQGPGKVTVDVFQLAKECFKIAIWVVNKQDFALVTSEALAEYLVCKNIEFSPAHASLSIVVPGTWQLLLDDMTTAEKICGLCCIVLLSKELDVGPWKDSYRQVSNKVYIQGLVETTSH